ncbi:PAS domain-containing protein [Tropicimonas sp. TH_r6]|uniref:PAS domain-containing protein n=1 Tax=Tropicimonas sp. TH_r6 TaxID=3082085 RepID=UPI002953DFF8|nr:PAS domain-containing protein [Tropicimonas sp. TH_r6]MDV7141704.1 PAS domain-containing protein [Tropicimonas sp. TH_r6]
MRFPLLQNVEEYWDRLRGDRLVPDRADLDPRRIQHALASAFILERLAPGIARFRLAGTHLNELMGMEVRGMPLTSFFLPESRKRVGTALEQSFRQPAKVRLALAGDRGIGKPPLDAGLLLLPLRSDGGEISRVLGCLATLGPIGRTPRRFDVRSTSVTPILGLEELDSDDRLDADWTARTVADAPDHPVLQDVSGFAEPVRDFRPSPHRPERTETPHLRVVTDDD